MEIRHAKLTTKDNRYEYFLTQEDFQYEFREETNGKATLQEYRMSMIEAKELFDEHILGIKQGLISMEISFKQVD